MVLLSISADKDSLKEGVNEISLVLPSRKKVYGAFQVASLCFPLLKCNPIAMTLGAASIYSYKEIHIAVRLFFISTFLATSLATPFVGVPAAQVLFALISAYANYKKHPNLFKMAAGAGSLMGVCALAGRFFGRHQEEVSLPTLQTMVSTVASLPFLASSGVSNIPHSGISSDGVDEFSILDDALINFEDANLDDILNDSLKAFSDPKSDKDLGTEWDGFSGNQAPLNQNTDQFIINSDQEGMGANIQTPEDFLKLDKGLDKGLDWVAEFEKFSRNLNPNFKLTSKEQDLFKQVWEKEGKPKLTHRVFKTLALSVGFSVLAVGVGAALYYLFKDDHFEDLPEMNFKDLDI